LSVSFDSPSVTGNDLRRETFASPFVENFSDLPSPFSSMSPPFGVSM
jgi:hypothetical protein